jgi:tripartite-type tricarboxylate transporter receptor subunit TctC
MIVKLPRVLFVCVVTAVVAITPAAAQSDYPTKSVRVIVPFAPGGVVDVMARLLMQSLSERLGKYFYVDNMGGAGGNIGTRYVALAPKDGYTLLVTSSSFVVNPSIHANAGYDPRKDFSSITIAAASPNVFVVNPSQPITTLQQLIDAVRKDPDKFSYAHSGVGTLPHLSGELFKQTAKLNLVAVPFTGAGPALQAIAGGQIPAGVLAFPASVSYIKSGALRGLAVTSEKRLAALADLPTVGEAGHPDLVAETLIFIAAPAGTPEAITNRLSAELKAIIKSPSIREKFDLYGFTPLATAPQESAARVSQELERWKKVVAGAQLGKE